MKDKVKAQCKKHSGKFNLAAYTALIIWCGNLLLEMGEMRSDDKYKTQTIEQCVDDNYKLELKNDQLMSMIHK